MAARRRATQALLSLACAMLALAAADTGAQAEAKPTQLSSTITLNAENVATASGRLSAGNQAVPSAPVTVSLNGAPVSSAQTSSDGAFSAQIDLKGQAPGEYTVGLGFPGTPEMGASSSSIKLTIGAAPGQLNATFDPALAAPGQLVTVTGNLVSATNTPVPNGKIIFSADRIAVPDADTSTGADGTFSTYVLVPEDYKESTLQLTAQFIGDAGTGPTSTVLPISVVLDVPVSPQPVVPTPTAPTAVPSATGQPTASQSATSTPKSPEDATGTSFPWWMVGLSGIVILAVGVTSWILIRERRNHRTVEVEGGLLDSFTDDDTPEPPTSPRRAGD